MVGRKILFAFGLMFFLCFIRLSSAATIDNCTHLTVADTYILSADIDAVAAINLSDSCIQIETDNIILNLNNFIISTKNQSINRAIRIDDDLSNITIKDGAIQNFTNTGYGVGIYLSGGYNHGNSNLRISNVRLLNNNYGLFLNNMTNARIDAAIDQPMSKTALYAWLVSNSTFNLFSRASTYGAVFDNMSYSIVTGHFDTNVIIAENQTTILGYLDIFHLLPPTVTTTTIQTQSKGIGLLCWNCSNNVLKDISAVGLIQGIDLTYYSTHNILGRIDLPLSGQYTGGKFGGVWLDVDAKYNQLCEIKGNIIDNCNQLILSSTCAGKYNTISDSCENIFNPSSYGTATDISLVLLTPLLPAISSTDYGFVSFLTTPFFLVIFLMSGLAIVVAKTTKNATFGLYTLMFLVFILTAITFTTFWIGFIFVIVIGFLLYKTAEKKEESA